MADFCKQCSIDNFGEDFGDLAGITKPEDFAEGKAVIVICEGCGVVQVDPDGVCISADCLEKGHKEGASGPRTRQS
jgi:hypothetical protein